MQKQKTVFTSPCGRPSIYRYRYEDNEQTITKGNVVSRNSGFYVVLMGVGTRRENPSVRMLSLSDMTERTSIVTKLKPVCVVAAMTCRCRHHQTYQQYCKEQTTEKLRVAHSFKIEEE